ncbi:DNA polymerase III subunit delta' [Phormidium sp. LEGE 05292]|uniref:DNA polymerase III subunit delta' n=1 Tax=[Phormidium] sp. LEGE 05292 TaxID=767427 RepID=UPI001880C0BB|nr:DNA polymerase III subunit delta' [Phormidium sp. LEGE 05292]MBE9230086.1 DNA polymerase III subunit delta' [Phormidium sp. LEGE 05292]
METTVNCQHFASVIGQPTAIKLLKASINSKRISNAFLFAGLDGVGKRLAAKCLIQALLMPAQESIDIAELSSNKHPDILWVMPTYQQLDKLLTETAAIAHGINRKTAPVIRISQVRELVEFAATQPMIAAQKVVVIEAAHCLNHQAASALLKTLESPINTLFILLTSRIQEVLPTIVSRCQLIPFRRLSNDDFARVLTQAGEQQILDNPMLLNMAQGSPGAAISSYQMLQSIPEEVLQQCSSLPSNLKAALSLAKTIDHNLEHSQQLWLIDYLQFLWWHSYQRIELIEKLAQAKDALLKLAQNRLVWEVTLANTIAV